METTTTEIMYTIPTRDMDNSYTSNENPRQANEHDPESRTKDTNADSKAGNKTSRGKIQSQDELIGKWTIYTIVGAIAGIILLFGLIAITVALCCRRDSNGLYKSTPV